MTRVYYKEASAAFIVFDINNASTYNNVKNWKNDIDLKVKLPNGNPIPVVLLANKCDLLDNGAEGVVSKDELNNFCKEHGIIAWYTTSAKDDIRISEAANRLIQNILEQGKDRVRKDSDTIVLPSGPLVTPPRQKCVCKS